MHTESNLQQLLDVQYQLVNAGVQKSIHPLPFIILFPPVAAGDQSPSEVEQECIQLAKELYSKYVTYSTRNYVIIHAFIVWPKM